MKTPLYETSAGALAALLASRSFVMADLYTFTLYGGGVLRYATSDVDMAYGGITWPASKVLFDSAGGSKAHWKLGMDTDSWNITLYPRPRDPLGGAAYPDTIGGIPFLAAIRTGALDGAIVQIDRAYLPAWPGYTGHAANPTGVITLFAGVVAEAEATRSGVALVINSHIERLGDTMPRNLYQAGCRHSLFDSQCGVAAGLYAVNGVIPVTLSGPLLTLPMAPPAGSGTYTLGTMAMTSGINAGSTRLIKAWSANGLTLMSGFASPLASGDGFALTPGCDKAMTTCAKFGNLANFGGMPFIPSPEAAV